MDDYQAYKYYLIIKTHFTNKHFDAFVHRTTKASVEKFMERNDSKLFGVVARKFEEPRHLIRFFVANISVGFFDFLYDFEKAINNLKKWEIYRSNVKYNFFSDLSVIELYILKKRVSFQEAAWKTYLEKSINIQSIFLIDKFTNMFSEFNSSLLFLHKEEILRIQKLDGFIKIPKDLQEQFFIKLKEIS